MSLLLFILLALFMSINIPISLSIGLATILSITFVSPVPNVLVVQRLFTGIDSFPLLAVPLFMVAGNLMERGGISRRLIDFASSLVGQIYGGLGIITILACMFFAAISGSAPATVVAIGSIMVPAMIKAGYDKAFAVALVAAGGTIGIVIPPSIPFVTYGISVNVSIGKLFAGGILPGTLMGLSLMTVCYLYSRMHGYNTGRTEVKRPLAAAREAILGLLMPVIILGGIYGGVFTPTEAAAVACVYSIVVGLGIYRELSLRTVFASMYDAAVPAAMVMLIIGFAQGMGWVMTTEQVPAAITAFVGSITQSQFSLLLFLNVFLLVVGCIMETNAAIIILGPILLPLLIKFNVDPVHFGIIIVINLAIGLLTPPLGVNLFVANGIRRDVSFKAIVTRVFPLLAGLLTVLMIVSYVPQLTLVLADMIK